MTKREAGSKGGSVSTPAKVEAVKRNGAKVGRPRECCDECRCWGSQYCGAKTSFKRLHRDVTEGELLTFDDFSVLQVSCTRPEGHAGDHSACSLSEHPMHRWFNHAPVEAAVKPKRSGKQCRTKYGPSVISRDRERAEHARKYEDSQS